jgi:hypothetical protein
MKTRDPAADTAGADTASAASPSPAAETVPAWRFLIAPRWLGWHALMVVSFWGMLWLGDWQFHRALSGNGLSWAYTFEWPLFSGFAVVFWAKTIRDEFRIRSGKIPDPRAARADPRVSALPAGLGTEQADQPADDAEDEDEELAKYNAYLARLNAGVKSSGK